jgi:hypothetical protein
MASATVPPNDTLAPVLMTLAGIAYGQPSAIPGYLAADPLTKGDWSLVWIAAEVEIPVNFAYIARSQSTGAYCIAIRGTYPNPFSPAYWDDANQDNPLGEMQPWPLGASDPADVGPRISQGTATGFTNIIELSNGAQSFAQAVAALPQNAIVYVTGHSLGGTLAPVIALWMTGLPNKTLLPTVYCFAGMTPGNQAFADLFGAGSKLAGRVTRYKNTLDSVPYGWDNVLATRSFYQPAPQGGLLVEGAIILLAAKLSDYGYAPIGEEIALPGNLSEQDISLQLIAFIIENLHQHLPDTYLTLLGAPLLPFQIGLGALVVPRASPMARQLIRHRVPVYFA